MGIIIMDGGDSTNRFPSKKKQRTRPDLREDPGGMKIRVALVGCGNIAYKHIKAMSAAVGQLEAPPSSPFLVTALIDPNPTNRAKVSQACVIAFGTSVPKQYDSLQQALDDDTNGTLFDTVDVMVPSLNELHEEVAIQAMRAQKNVILEK